MAGTKVWEASYLPFGGVQTSTGANNTLRFPGQWFQSETGLHQNWMRDYDPTLGRYLQADPLGLVDGASVYGYALQNPGKYIDRFGTESQIPNILPNSPAGLDQYWEETNPNSLKPTFTRTCDPNQTLQFHAGTPTRKPPQSRDHWHYFHGPTPNNRTKWSPQASSLLNKKDHLYPGFAIDVTDCTCLDSEGISVPHLVLPPLPSRPPRRAGGGKPSIFSPPVPLL